MAFFQTPPELGNQFHDDVVLKDYLDRVVSPDALEGMRPTLEEMGELAGGALYQLAMADRESLPTLTQWDAWGHRIDRIELTALWKEAKRLAAQKGLVATAYEGKAGASSRIHQFALAYLMEPSSAVYSCPLAMTDGAARTLLASGNRALIDRAVPRLTSRDPEHAWTSGQWMTERTGGSDVGLTQTVARQTADGWRLYGTKWFTSAVTSEMALTLARPERNGLGGRGLALFYLEVRDDQGRLNHLQVNRLKDKLGTRMVPTAELTLDGTVAIPVGALVDGVKAITPMLTITRTWNAVGAVSGMRRALALAKDYARKRVAFGAPLSDKPLHLETLATLQAIFEGAFLLAFRAVELLGRDEAGIISEEESHLLRLITPIAKLTTAKQAVQVASEAIEGFGGAGYVEDTGLPLLLRDAQVLPIWEGTTNVLSLDLLRALARGGELGVLRREIETRAGKGTHPTLKAAARTAVSACDHACAWLEAAVGRGPGVVEAGARRFAQTLGHAWELALLVEQAAFLLEKKGDLRCAHAAARFARMGIDQIVKDDDLDAARALALA